MGEGYELIYPEEERIGIDHVIVDIDSGLYEDKKIFSDCSRLRDLIYHYGIWYTGTSITNAE